MLFTENLEELVFHRHKMVDIDELIVVSGYVGPDPISKLKDLPFKTKVVYGMYGAEGIQKHLHVSLVEIQKTEQKLNILYSKKPVHSKCYIWRKQGDVVSALIGSANFSRFGLTTPYREILAEASYDTFQPLNNYVTQIIDNSISCLEHAITTTAAKIPDQQTQNDEITVSLLKKNGEIHKSGGLNWGQNSGNNHTNKNDAYIPIRKKYLEDCPLLFPEKKEYPLNPNQEGRKHRHNDSIEIIWDDRKTMAGLLEGTQNYNGLIFPKQISSFPSKSILGRCFRDRLEVPSGQPVLKHHLERYGRTDVKVTLIQEGVYYFDFSKKIEK